MQKKAQATLQTDTPCYNKDMAENEIQKTATISIPDLILNYVEPVRFETACRSCSKYGVGSACPPHDFNVVEWWSRFAYLDLYAVSIPGDADWDEADKRLSDRLLVLERAVPESLCLLSGSSGGKEGEAVRYSIQSLGGNVEKLCRELLSISLQWPKEGTDPGRLTLVGGLLRSKRGPDVRPMETKDLILRESLAEDISRFSEWEAEDAVKEYFSIEDDQTPQQVEQIFWEDRKNEERKQYTIVLKRTGEPIGRIVMNDLQPGWKAEIFRIYIGDPALRGNGYGRQAMEALLALCFEEWKVERVYLDHYTGNPAGRLYLDLGFRYEGVLRKNCRKNGQLYDVHLMSMLRPEYEEAVSRYGSVNL